MDKIKNILKFIPEEFKIALTEAVRLAVLAIIPILIASIDVATGAINIEWALVYATILLTVLRFADKWIHEVGKSKNNDVMAGGLTRF